jgi:hypothetical protein
MVEVKRLDKRTRIKVIVSTVCLIISIGALYAFAAIIDVSTGWRIVLIVIATGWIVSGILNLIECFKIRK